MNPPNDSTPSDFTSLPKVDLHRHLEGSLRLQTMLDLARKLSMTLPAPVTAATLSRLVQIQADEPQTFENFLSKFNTLRMFYRSADAIGRITREMIEDAARDNVRYMEIRFTPVALSRAERFSLGDVMDWVCQNARESAQEHGLNVRLIASVNRHESVELAEQVIGLAAERQHNGIVGIDLAGNEVQYPALPFVGLFKQARKAGLRTTVHAGEWGGPLNVREAIEKFTADRIGHGVRIMEDPHTVALARERQIPFEVCITSNYQSGAVRPGAEHPARAMLAAGLNVILGTDDPSISQITLSGEYQVASQALKIPLNTIQECILAGARAAFLSTAEKHILIETLTREMGPA